MVFCQMGKIVTYKMCYTIFKMLFLFDEKFLFFDDSEKLKLKNDTGSSKKDKHKIK